MNSIDGWTDNACIQRMHQTKSFYLELYRCTRSRWHTIIFDLLDISANIVRFTLDIALVRTPFIRISIVDRQKRRRISLITFETAYIGMCVRVAVACVSVLSVGKMMPPSLRTHVDEIEERIGTISEIGKNPSELKGKAKRRQYDATNWHGKTELPVWISFHIWFSFSPISSMLVCLKVKQKRERTLAQSLVHPHFGTSFSENWFLFL